MPHDDNYLPVDYSGRHIMVVGGTSGINLGIAEAFATAGANVSVLSRSQEKVTSAIQSLSKIGSPKGAVADGKTADVRDPAALSDAVGQLVGSLGAIDVVISGAAGNFLCAADRLSPNGFRTVVDIDLNGSFNVANAVFPHLKKPGASILYITAPQGAIPMRYQAHACAAKAGVDQLTRTLALEWGPVGIRINAVSPGPIEGTEGFDRLIAPNEAQMSEAMASVPVRRFGQLSDIANLALFLSSPFASFISGAVVQCDGGGSIDSVRPALEAAGSAMVKTPT